MSDSETLGKIARALTEISGKLDRVLKVMEPKEERPPIIVDGEEIPYMPGFSADT